jgi:hypothetical protein
VAHQDSFSQTFGERFFYDDYWPKRHSACYYAEEIGFTEMQRQEEDKLIKLRYTLEV